MKGKKLKHSDSLKFMFAGNSKFTTINTETDNKFTYHIKIAKDSNLYFVIVLKNAQYTFIGTILEGEYKHGKKSKIENDDQSVLVIKHLVKHLVKNNLQECVEIWHQGTCGKCGRPLTVPASIDYGIGPECMKKLSKVDRRDKFLEILLRKND